MHRAGPGSSIAPSLLQKKKRTKLLHSLHRLSSTASLSKQEEKKAKQRRIFLWTFWKITMEVLQRPPSASSFTPLAEHQSRTPQSFYGGPPVLHYHSSRCKVVILESDLSASPALNTLRGGAAVVNGSSGAAHESQERKDIVIDGVDVFVTSE